MPRTLLTVAIVAAWPAVLSAGSLAVPNLPMPSEYVDDLAHVVNAQDKHTLNGILQELEQKTGVQYIILTVDTTGGIPIEEFSITLAHNRWKLGQKGKDNGLLFTLAVKDKTYRFEVGYGLEGFVTDRFVGQVGRDVLVPYLRQGDYSRGIYEANLQVVRKIADETGVHLTGMPNLPQIPTRGGPAGRHREGILQSVCPCCSFLAFLLLIILMSGRGGGGWWLLLPFLFRGPGAGYRRGGYFGGGFGGFGGSTGGGFGGGFGHFGGGGGGGFGGGGATGHW
jgi:uncharacterized protein